MTTNNFKETILKTIFSDVFFNGNDIYDRPRLSDINPNVSDIDHNHRPNFRPYLPNWNGEENPMDFNDQKTPSSPRSFYRSESVVISRDSNGNVKKNYNNQRPKW